MLYRKKPVLPNPVVWVFDRGMTLNLLSVTQHGIYIVFKNQFEKSVFGLAVSFRCEIYFFSFGNNETVSHYAVSTH